VTVEREAKSQSVETTFDTDLTDGAEMLRTIGRQADELSKRLRAKGRAGRTIGIKVRLDDWTTVTRARTVEEPTNDPRELRSVASELLNDYAPPRPVRLLGVRVAGFTGVRPSDPVEPRVQLELEAGPPA
jgi:DNA polymerase-4